MRRSFCCRRRAPAVILLATLGLAGCATPQEIVSSKEDSLAAAGFVVRPANTPERQAMLGKLPPHQFVRRVHGDDVDYVYADPLVCDCLYVGSQQAYGRFQLHVQQQRLADQQEMTAQTFSDPAWNWGAWGPWGPSYGFGFGTGYGW
ncbi:hypothetical protein [Lichenicoccus sp.]|uniref:hypothetical protein n=1 Tax=Lichenicoccus sp. TaxID=2781899 RepID=UPI003D0993AF